MTATRVAGLVRISQLTEATTSPEKQRANIEATCQRKGWPKPDWFEDLGVSGRSGAVLHRSRDDLEARLADYDVVIFDKIDRVARSVADFYRFVQAAEKAGTQLVAASDPVDMTSPQGQALVGILAVFAQLESQTIGERIRQMNAYLRRAGKRGGGQRPWHLDSVPHPSGKGRVYRPNPERTAILLDAIERLENGASLRSICTEWNRQGVRASRGGKWDSTALRRLLRRPAVWGGQEHMGKLVLDDDGLPRVDPDMAVITAERHDALIQKITGATRTRSDTSGGLLSGIIHCHDGFPMYLNVAGKPRYVCSGYYCEQTIAIQAKFVERYMVEQTREAFGNGDREIQIPRVSRVGHDTGLIAGLRKALQEQGEPSIYLSPHTMAFLDPPVEVLKVSNQFQPDHRRGSWLKQVDVLRFPQYGSALRHDINHDPRAIFTWSLDDAARYDPHWPYIRVNLRSTHSNHTR